MKFEATGAGTGNLELFNARLWEVTKMIEQGANIYEEYKFKQIPITVIKAEQIWLIKMPNFIMLYKLFHI